MATAGLTGGAQCSAASAREDNPGGGAVKKILPRSTTGCVFCAFLTTRPPIKPPAVQITAQDHTGHIDYYLLSLHVGGGPLPQGNKQHGHLGTGE